MSKHDVIDWLRDVRAANGFMRFFFIWDEFTEYFRNNANNLTGLQEIELAEGTAFELMAQALLRLVN